MSPVCPYCSGVIGAGDAGQTACPSCATAHHADCWEENGGCTVFGCASAPDDGPVVSIRTADLIPGPPSPAPLPEMTFGGYGLPSRAHPHSTLTQAAFPKNRTAFILLGVFLGFLGAHNFYAGYRRRAVAQLCVSVFTLFLGAIASWIWAIVEVCTVERDAENHYML